MKPQTEFVAARALASHCPELFAAPDNAPDPVGLLDALGRRLGKPLGQAIARLTGGDVPQIEVRQARETRFQDVVSDVGLPAAGFVMRAGGGNVAPIFAVFDPGCILSLVDRTFGGSGKPLEAVPEEFPLSVELFLPRLEGAMVQALEVALEGANGHGVEPLARGCDPERLRPYPAQEPLVCVDLMLRGGLDEADQGADSGPVAMMLAFPAETVLHLLHHVGEAQTAPRTLQSAPGPHDAPFADVPFTLGATLIDMRIGLSKLSSLRPGDVLPVAIARNVPLRVRDRIIAHGTVGELDERVALQITQAF